MPVLLEALSRAEQLQQHCVTLAWGPTWAFLSVTDKLASNVPFCSNASVWQLEAQRLGGGAEVLHH